MSGKALLVGCNYPGSDSPLGGCVNDVNNMYQLLVETMGFPEEDIFMLVDDGEAATEENYPSKANIEAGLSYMMQNAQPGDSLLFFFAGHGTQVEDDGEEPDGFDEAICASDKFNLITDDDLREILINLPEGAKFTMISDSCHSGTLLDQTEVVIEGPKEDDPPLPEGVECACETEASRCVDICAHLSARLGCEVCPGDVRIAIACAEQDNCSVKYKCVWDWIQENIIPDMPEDFTLDQLFCAACEQMDRSMVPRAGKCSEHVLPEGLFTLITGCESDQTSGDTGSGGVMTTALCAVVRAMKEQDPEAPLSARSVVYHVRENLAQGGAEQNPCLECCEETADEPFLWCPTC